MTTQILNALRNCALYRLTSVYLGTVLLAAASTSAQEAAGEGAGVLTPFVRLALITPEFAQHFHRSDDPMEALTSRKTQLLECSKALRIAGRPVESERLWLQSEFIGSLVHSIEHTKSADAEIEDLSARLSNLRALGEDALADETLDRIEEVHQAADHWRIERIDSYLADWRKQASLHSEDTRWTRGDYFRSGMLSFCFLIPQSASNAELLEHVSTAKMYCLDLASEDRTRLSTGDVTLGPLDAIGAESVMAAYRVCATIVNDIEEGRIGDAWARNRLLREWALTTMPPAQLIEESVLLGAPPVSSSLQSAPTASNDKPEGLPEDAILEAWILGASIDDVSAQYRDDNLPAQARLAHLRIRAIAHLSFPFLMGLLTDAQASDYRAAMEQAVEDLAIAASNGDPSAIFNITTFYFAGIDVGEAGFPSEAEMLANLRSLAAGGGGSALLELGFAYENGHLGLRKLPTVAVALYAASARTNNPGALVNLASACLRGDAKHIGLEPSDAFDLFTAASEADPARTVEWSRVRDAHYNLAVIYDNGHYVETWGAEYESLADRRSRDLYRVERAREHYRIAAALGHELAIHNLSILYRELDRRSDRHFEADHVESLALALVAEWLTGARRSWEIEPGTQVGRSLDTYIANAERDSARQSIVERAKFVLAEISANIEAQSLVYSRILVPESFASSRPTSPWGDVDKTALGVATEHANRLPLLSYTAIEGDIDQEPAPVSRRRRTRGNR